MLPSATLLTQLAPKGSPLTTWLGLPIGQTPVFPSPTLAGCPGETRQNIKEIKMKLRLSIWTMLIAGSLLSAPTTPAGQIPLKNQPLERQTDQNLNMKRYVAAGDQRIFPTGSNTSESRSPIRHQC
jgi:hypothetical protein